MFCTLNNVVLSLILTLQYTFQSSFFSKYRQCIVKFKCQLISNEVLACIVYNDTSTFINDFFFKCFCNRFCKATVNNVYGRQ